MYKVFNKPALSRKERFSRALMMGFGASVLLVLIYFLVNKVLAIPSIFYVAFGYAIGNVIAYFGHGVQIQFSILSVALTCAVIFCCDMIYANGQIAYLSYALSDIYDLLYRGAAIYFAFTEARIIKGR